MLRQAREFGPALLVPLAWIFVTAAHLDVVAASTLFIAHVVMSVLLAVFAVTGRADMREGTLRVWWWVIAVGFVVTLLGTVGFRIDTGGALLQTLALYGWMLLPVVGFVDTARRGADRPRRYYGGGLASVLGAIGYAAGFATASPSLQIGGLLVVGTGQTVAIVDAAFGY